MTVSERDQRIIEECKASDEPCIVFRGKDALVPGLLEMYAQESSRQGATSDFKDAVMTRWQEICDWQEDNPDRVKIPDLRPGEATS